MTDAPCRKLLRSVPRLPWCNPPPPSTLPFGFVRIDPSYTCGGVAAAGAGPTQIQALAVGPLPYSRAMCVSIPFSYRLD